MLQQLSWTNYFTAIAIITIFYYLYVLVVYYKVELQRLFSGNGNNQKVLSMQSLMPARDIDNIEDQNNQNTDLFSLGHQLMAAIQPIIAKAADAKSPKEELLFGLQQVIRNGYQHLKATSVQTTIHKYIQQQCIDHLNMSLSADDLQQLWV